MSRRPTDSSPARIPEALLPNPEKPPEALPLNPVQLEAEDPTPPSLGLVPLRQIVLFPGMVTPMVILHQSSIQVVRRAAGIGAPIAFVTQRNSDVAEPEREDLYDIGTVGRVLRALRFADGTLRVLVQGLRRVRIGSLSAESPVPRVRLTDVEELGVDSSQAEILRRHLRDDFRMWGHAMGKTPPELENVINALEHPGRLADYVASNLPLKPTDLQALLEETVVDRRLAGVRQHLHRERELADLNARIHSNVQSAMDKNQREYWLKEQVRALKEELGEIDPSVSELEALKAKIAEAEMPPSVEEEALRELERMNRMHRESAEYTVARTYIDWLLDMPWQTTVKERTGLPRVQRVLDQDHTGLEEVKERILEYMSVRQLNPDGRSPILCFVGPPGVGKTSLGRSIARALGRPFQRIALGGVKDESEIRGHRRTYIGSMPGRIVQAMRRAKAKNPVLLLDEIDKVGNDFRGDPASALLEALDPEQNHEFVDRYLDVPYDLSQVLFLCTANQRGPIPPALQDRFEIIELSGYIEEEKLAIASQHLLPRIRKEHGLRGQRGKMDNTLLQEVIRGYTSEAGVRELERQLSKIARKVARRVVRGEKRAGRIDSSRILDFLGPKKFLQERTERMDLPGIAVGLAWTPVGGDILFIEATQMAQGSGKFKITGQLGDVMKESAETALSWVRANAKRLGIDATKLKNSDLHVHVPQGGIPKDGPSAGITLVVALVSLLTGKRVRDEVALSGEITLRGKVLPVGGIKEKVLAARRAGIRTVCLPVENEKDLLDIPEALRDSVRTIFVQNIDDVWDEVFGVED